MSSLYNQLSKKEDFKALLKTYWQKPNFSTIKYFFNENQNEERGNPLDFIEKKFYLRFDFGVLHKQSSKSEGKNEIIRQGTIKF